MAGVSPDKNIILDSVSDGVTINYGRKFLYANKTFSQMIGYDLKTLLEIDVFDIVAQEYRPMVKTYTSLRQSGGDAPSQYDLELIRKDGKRVSVEFNVSRIDFLGKKASLTTIRDISKRKENEIYLEHLNNLSSKIAGATTHDEIFNLTCETLDEVLNIDRISLGFIEKDDIVFSHTNDGRIKTPVIISMASASISRRAIVSAKTQNIRDVSSDPEYIKLPLNVPEKTVSGLYVPIIENNKVIVILSLDRFYEETFSENDVVFVETLSRQIASAIIRIKQSKRILESEERLRSFMDSATVGFSILDSKLRLIYINDARVKLSRNKRENLLGSTIHQLYEGLDIEKKVASYLRVLETGISETYQDIVEWPNGDVEHVIVSIFKMGENLGISTLDITKRVKAEAAVLESEERGRIFRESATESICILDKDMRMIEANQSWLKTANLDKDEIIGKHLLDIVPNMPVERYNLFKQVLETGKPANLHAVEAATRSGNILDISVFKSGEYLGIMSRNVSDQIEYQKKLESLHQNAVMLSTADTLADISRISRDTILNVIDSEYCSLGVVENKNLIYKFPWNEGPPIVLPLDGTGISVKAVNERRSMRINDIRKTDRHVQSTWGAITKSELDVPIFLDDRVVGALNIESDKLNAFTEMDQKLIEIFASHISAAMSRIQYNERMNALHRITIDLNYAKNLEDIVNISFKFIRGTLGYNYSSFQVLNENKLISLLTDGGAPTDLVIYLDGKGITSRAARERRTVHAGDLRDNLDYVKGSMNSLSELAVPIILNDDVLGILNVESIQLNAFTSNDIKLMETLAHNISGAIFKLQADEKQTRLETDLLTERLKTEQEQELNQLKTRFMSTATHEIRTPLTSIQGYVEIIRDIEGSLSETQRSYFDVIHKNVERLSILTEDLLDLQRLEENKMSLLIEPVSIRELVDGMRNEFLPILGEKQQELVLDVQDIVVNFDRLRIMQVLINLLSNASKFSPSGAEIVLKAFKQEDAVRFDVIDQGIGLEDDNLEKLFTPFPGILVEGNVRGTGLGLSICRGILELHKGRVWAKTGGLGHGMTFSFTIPI